MNKGRLIIIEGPDECGKSTLSMALARALGGVVLHSTASKMLFPALPDYHKNIMENVERNITELGHIIILDRFYHSELAYGELFRPHSEYLVDGMPYHLFDRVSQLPHLFIFCFSHGGWGRYALGHTDPAHSLKRSEYEHVWQRYEELAGQETNVLTYLLEKDGTDMGMVNFIQTVRAALNINEPRIPKHTS